MSLAHNIAKRPFGVILLPILLFSNSRWTQHPSRLDPLLPSVGEVCLWGEAPASNAHYCPLPRNYTIQVSTIGTSFGASAQVAIPPSFFQQLLVFLISIFLDILLLVGPDLVALAARRIAPGAGQLWKAVKQRTPNAPGIRATISNTVARAKAIWTRPRHLVLAGIVVLAYLAKAGFLSPLYLFISHLLSTLRPWRTEFIKAAIYMVVGRVIFSKLRPGVKFGASRMTTASSFFKNGAKSLMMKMRDFSTWLTLPTVLGAGSRSFMGISDAMIDSFSWDNSSSFVASSPQKFINVFNTGLPFRPSRSENNLAYIANKNAMLLEAGAQPIRVPPTHDTPTKTLKPNYKAPLVSPRFVLTIATPPRRADGSLIIPTTPPSAPPTPQQLAQSPMKPTRSAGDGISAATSLDWKLKELTEEGEDEALEILRGRMEEDDAMEPVAKKLTYYH